MAACKSLVALARECGRNAKVGISADVYFSAYDDLLTIEGTTEKYTETIAGLVDEIGVDPLKKFVKVGTVLNQGGINEDFTGNDNGSFDIVKQLAISLTNLGSLSTKTFVESLIGQPVTALVKLATGTWVALGLNGQFQLRTSAGIVDPSNNGRVVTLAGSDSVLVQPVDPLIIPTIIAA